MPTLKDPAALQRFLAQRLRREAPGADSLALSPREHGAFAESFVRENPAMAPAMLGLIPAYAAYREGKAALLGEESPPTLDRMAEGYRGTGRATVENLKDYARLVAGILRGEETSGATIAGVQ